jgi:hypothetical protein
MGRMKEMYIKILEANGDKLPYDLTISDLPKMKELEIYEWHTYNRAISKKKEDKISSNEKLEIYVNEGWVKVRKDHESNLKKNELF